MSRATAQFAQVVLTFEPYSRDVVFVGGWVHALYLAEVNETGAVRTDDVDISIPMRLLANDRPTLLELAAMAGFERDPLSDMEGVALLMAYTDDDGMTVPLDFLTEGDPRIPVEIIGQQGLLALGYPGQLMLLENTRDMVVGPDIHHSLHPSRLIRIPTLSAYCLQKALSSNTRSRLAKQAKDLVYLYEIARHPILGARLLAELPALFKRYPDEYARWKSTIQELLDTPSVQRAICEQLELSGRVTGSTDSVLSYMRARFRRLHALLPDI